MILARAGTHQPKLVEAGQGEQRWKAQARPLVN